MRAQLKSIIPEWFWPFMRWCDKWLTYLLYIAYWLKRMVKYPQLVPKDNGETLNTVKRFSCSLNLDMTDAKRLSERLAEVGIGSEEGRHSVYIGDQDALVRLFPDLKKRYPGKVGLKIVRSREFAADGTPYYTSARLAPASTWFSMRAVGSMREKMIVSNLLSMFAVAPKCYGIVELDFDSVCYFAFVVEHIEGEILTGPAAKQFMVRFSTACREIGVKPISIREHKDLRYPSYNNNIVSIGPEPAQARYVDLQNFTLTSKSVYNVIKNESECQARLPGRCDKDAWAELEQKFATVSGHVTLVTENGSEDAVRRALYLRGAGNFTVIARQKTIADEADRDPRCGVGVA